MGESLDQKSLFRFMLRDPQRDVTLVIGIGSVYELFEDTLFDYRERTKCFHHVRVSVDLDPISQECAVKIDCDECMKANKTREVLTQ
ncbi:MAG: hypothetical protein ACREOP_05360 [Thermodesulfobacteriota bacterium]